MTADFEILGLKDRHVNILRMSRFVLALVLRMLKVVVGTSKSFRHLLACSIQGLKVLLPQLLDYIINLSQQHHRAQDKAIFVFDTKPIILIGY